MIIINVYFTLLYQAKNVARNIGSDRGFIYFYFFAVWQQAEVTAVLIAPLR